MNLDRFIRDASPRWDALDELLARAGRRPERLPPGDVLLLAARYREAAADLAVARRHFPQDPVVLRLSTLVGRGRHTVYATGVRRESALSFFTRRYWRLV